MKFGRPILAGILGAAVVTTAAFGGGHADKQTMAAVEARKHHMQLYAFNLGLLGGMAKGDIAYDAAAATAAASNLAALASLDQSRYWPPGSDTDALGEDTKALPAIWASDSTARDKGMELAKAAAAMQDSAGESLEALQAAIGAVGKSCGSCHESYRQKSE